MITLIRVSSAGAGFIVEACQLCLMAIVTGNHGGNDFWIVKLKPVVGICRKNNFLSAFDCLPNPVAHLTNISFS